MNPKSCPICHSTIPDNAPGGLCPACVLRGAEELPAPGRGAPSIEEIAAAFPALEILELIGQGGMGFVYKARQSSLERYVALKILSPELGRDPAFAERFAREARTLGKLQHPNIVTIFEHGECGGFYYLLMEYVDGVNLRQAMRAGRFTPEQALSIVPGICDALQAAHAQGIWHRDIKPENILLDRNGCVKIADFGIARLVGDPQRDFTLTLTGHQLGSAAYMAPEQHEQPHSVDHRADIYSLGVVIYEMLTGELPLGRFPIPSQRAEVGQRIDEIVLRTLEKERELRQQSANEVKTEVEGADVRKTSDDNKPRPKRRWRRMSIAACGFLLLGMLGYLLMANLVSRYRLSQMPRPGYRSLIYSDEVRFAFSHPKSLSGGASITIPMRSTRHWLPEEGLRISLQNGKEIQVRVRVVKNKDRSIEAIASCSDDGTNWETQSVSMKTEETVKLVSFENGTRARIAVVDPSDQTTESVSAEEPIRSEQVAVIANTQEDSQQNAAVVDTNPLSAPVEKIFREMNAAANRADPKAFARYTQGDDPSGASAATMMPFLGKIGFLRQIDPRKHWPGPTLSIPDQLLLVSLANTEGDVRWMLFGYRNHSDEGWKYTKATSPFYHATAVIEFQPREGDAEAILRSHLASPPIKGPNRPELHSRAEEDGVFEIIGIHQSPDGAASNANYAIEGLLKTLQPFGLAGDLKIRARAEAPEMPWVSEDESY